MDERQEGASTQISPANMGLPLTALFLLTLHSLNCIMYVFLRTHAAVPAMSCITQQISCLGWTFSGCLTAM